jgi:predicted DNA-binding protein (UPF0251 family)
MPRPIKPRKIGYIPRYKLFHPAGKVDNSNEYITLLHDELEALRLKDIENLNQMECAKIMEVSRQTFQLIIESAHRKTASALVEGKSLKITGGNYILSEYSQKCPQCGQIHRSETRLNGPCQRRRRCRNCQE